MTEVSIVEVLSSAPPQALRVWGFDIVVSAFISAAVMFGLFEMVFQRDPWKSLVLGVSVGTLLSAAYISVSIRGFEGAINLIFNDGRGFLDHFRFYFGFLGSGICAASAFSVKTFDIMKDPPQIHTRLGTFAWRIWFVVAAPAALVAIALVFWLPEITRNSAGDLDVHFPEALDSAVVACLVVLGWTAFIYIPLWVLAGLLGVTFTKND